MSATPAPDGVLVVDKPSGWTSHDVVARVRRIAGTRKVGHAGTLDPMATGVLVLGLGRATRLLGYLSATTKAYDATMRLGQSTVTDDAEGEVVASADAGALTDAQIGSALAALRGDIMQTPAAVSAVKVEGKRAYARVRAGDEVALTPRQVRVNDLAVLAVRRSGSCVDVDLRVVCSSGTYVRALARDAGESLGVGGHLIALRRTRVGPFGVEHSHTLDELASTEPGALPVMPLDEIAAATFPVYAASDAEAAAVRNGRPLQLGLGAVGEPVAVVAPDGAFLALYEQRGAVAKPLVVFAPA